jgi:hypothetical protein
MNELLEFSLDTENAQKNYNLARWYENQGHTAPALTYYLRAAERSEDNLLAYTALIRGYCCYNSQGSRDHSAKILLQNAISFLPKRPEAYFLLSQFYEKQQNWQESYIYASIGLDCCDFNSASLPDNVDYPGKYGLIFQKAICGYWWGKGQEARMLFQELIDNYEMEKKYYNLVVDNITRLGSGPKEIVFRQYTKENLDKLKFKFNSCEQIEENYSQVYQDMFALFMHNGKRNGTYLEIGSGDPHWLNNTYLLESQFDWKGVGVEYDYRLCEKYSAARKNPVVCQDAHQIDFRELLRNGYDTKEIDYLQLDCEPSESTYNVLKSLPLDEYKFAVITYEHDYYVDISRTYRDKSREYLKSKGYELVISNVSPTTWSSFEDWWVHPDLVSRERIEQIKNTDDTVKKIDDYMLSSNTIKQEQKDFFSISKGSNTAWIVDNFYENPDEVRKFALQQDFLEGGIGRGFIGRRTHQQFLFAGLKERFEEIVGRKITKWEEHGMNGRFQVAWAGEPLVWHCDSQKWGGMLYLTPDAPYQCGTTLYAHKQTRARNYYEEGWDAAWKDIPGDPHLDGTSFEPVDVLGNVYNRLVIFDASSIHSASQYFGTVMDNARLWQMYFFDTE